MDDPWRLVILLSFNWAALAILFALLLLVFRKRRNRK